MKFSIIVPFKKGTDFLRDCLASLNEQIAYVYLDTPIEEDMDTVKDAKEIERAYTTVPYRDFEVLLVLDHTTDDIKSLLLELDYDYSVRILKLGNTTGVSAARNLGISEAKGDYIYLLDSDDYLYPNALFRLDEASVDAEMPDVIYGKKIWTWYTRNGYLATHGKQDEKNDSEDSADEASEDADQESGNDNEQNNESDSEQETEQETEQTEEELAALKAALRKEARARRKQAARDKARELDEEMRGTLNDVEYEEFRRTIATRRLVYKRKGIGNISALHVAIRRELVVNNKIQFPEDIKYYADCRFICEVLYKAHTFRKAYRSRYVKHKHGDPINFPSLAQENVCERFDDLVESYSQTMDYIPAESVVRRMIDKKFIFYYTKFFVKMLRRRGGDIWRTERFEKMRSLMSRVSPETIKVFGRYRRRHIRALLAGDVDKAYKLVSFHLGKKKLKKCILSRKARIKAFYVHLFMKKPVQDNWIMFECFFGKSYGDNPKAVYEYIAQHSGKDCKLIWSMEEPRGSKIPYAHKTVKRGGMRYAYYLARCKYFVFNTKQPNWMVKRREQVFLETWHGTPLKRLAFDMEDNFSAAPGYKKQIYRLTRKWDYLVSANAFSSEVFRSCFMYKGNMLEYGYPRNDILHRPDRDELATSIRKKLGIPLDKKTILYAPTWRDDEYYGSGRYKFTLKLELPKLKEALGDEYVILLRTHYYIADKLDVTGMEGFAYNLSKYDDIADIYLISDICITDYSSVFFDYANLKRPMLFYTYDIDKYRDMLRGFYFDMEATVPGPLLYTTEEVIDAIKDIDSVSARFATRYDAFYERFCGWENGHASENIVKEVLADLPFVAKL